MMARYICAAKSCFNTYLNKPDLRFFKFPKDNRSYEWARNAGRLDLLNFDVVHLNRTFVLCAEHFEDTWFVNPELKFKLKTNLKPVPTIFENNLVNFLPTSLKKKLNITTSSKSSNANQSVDCGIAIKPKVDDAAHVSCPSGQIESKENVAESVKSVQQSVVEENDLSRKNCKLCAWAASNAPHRSFADINSSSETEIREFLSSTFALVESKEDLSKYICSCCESKLLDCSRIYACIQKKLEGKCISSSGKPSPSEWIEENWPFSLLESNRNCSDEFPYHFSTPMINDKTADKARVADCRIEGVSETNNEVCVIVEDCGDKFKSLSPLNNGQKKDNRELKKDNSEITGKQSSHLAGNHTSKENCCDYCGLQFRSLERFKKHLDSHKNCENFCSFCGKEFRNIKNKRIHIMKMHSSEMCDVLCEICGLQFKTLKQLKTHSSTHKTQEYFCSYCGREFSSIANKLVHMKGHSARPRDMLCEICGRLFFDLRSLNSHQKQHVSRSAFFCGTCKKSFESESELKEHKSKHLKMFSCPECSKMFHSKNYLRQHMSSHYGFNPFSCYCGSSFNRSGNLMQHMKKKHLEVASDTRAFECRICKRDLKSALRLRWHEAKHSGNKKPFDCELCGSRFSRFHYYKVHKLCHTGDRPYKCRTCSQAFRTKYTLLQHMMIHKTIYPFKCHICDQVFKKRYTLNAHKVTHTGDTPYKCQYCNRQYTQKASLTRHLKQHTMNTMLSALIEVVPSSVQIDVLDSNNQQQITFSQQTIGTEEHCLADMFPDCFV